MANALAGKKPLKARLWALLLSGAMGSQAALAVPLLTTTATPGNAAPGAAIDIDVRIADVADLYAYQFSLAFNPAVLQAVAVNRGPFLASGGSTFFDGGTIDNTAGTISFVFETLVGSVPGVGGSGLLVNIDFSARAPGSSVLAFSDVLFVTRDLADIAVQAQNGSVAVVPEPAMPLLLGAGLAVLAPLAGRARRRRG